MFTTFRPSPGDSSSSSSGTTGTEKLSSEDYADLEKRADGRWSVQTRHVDLGATVDAVAKNSNRGSRLAARRGVLLFIALALIISVTFVGITSADIAQNSASMRPLHLIVVPIALSLWVVLFPTCLLGLYATSKDHVKLFSVFFFAFICHWALDLASIIVFLLVAYQRDVTHPSICLERGREPGCVLPVSPMFVIVTVTLCLFKIIATYMLYLLYKYRITLLSRVQLSFSPTNTRSSPRSSSSSFKSTRLSPFSHSKFKSKAFSKSPRQGRPWPPTNIPTIKIDLASDQSSASSYSNGSSGTGSSGFAVFEFAAKYPSLRTTPLDPIGENLKAALERERNKDEEREREEADLGLVKARSAVAEGGG